MKRSHLRAGANALLTPDNITVKLPECATLPTCNNGRKHHVAMQNNLLWRCDGSAWNAVGPTTVTTRTNGTSIGTTSNGNVTATCNADEICIGGGAGWSTVGQNFIISSSRPSGSTGWFAEGRNNSSGGAETLTAYAICRKSTP